MLNFKFLAFSFLSAFIELGILVEGYREGRGLEYLLLLVLMYQLGNLFESYHLGKEAIIPTALVLLILIFINRNLFLLPFVLFTSLVTQNIRRELKSAVPRYVKRIFRVLGFFLAFFCTKYLLLSVMFIILFYYLGGLVKGLKRGQKVNFDSEKILRLTMIVHQIHYFSYAYVLIYIFMTTIENRKFGFIFLALIYSSGWLTYLSSEIVWRKLNNLYTLIGAHLALALIFMVMFFYNTNLVILSGMWIITGIFGGTVFIINNEYEKKSLQKVEDMDENLGHILGVILAILILTLRFKPFYALIVSCIMACLVSCLGCFLMYCVQGGKNEQI